MAEGWLKVVHEVCSEWHGSTIDQFSYTEVKGALQSAKLILSKSIQDWNIHTLYSLLPLPSIALRRASRSVTIKASAFSRGIVYRPSILTRMEWPSCSSRGSCQDSTETATSARGIYQTPNQNTDTVCIFCRKTFTELQVAWISATVTTT